MSRLLSALLICLPSLLLCKEMKTQMMDDHVTMKDGMSDDSMPTNPSAFAMFEAYVTALPIPEIIDLRQGGSIDMVIGKTSHTWGGGMVEEGVVYGYGVNGKEPSYPGPTILVMEGVSVNITWYNNISAPHILEDYVVEDLLEGPAVCYPECGVPVITHVHGMETTVSSDGSPQNSFGVGYSRTDMYPNTQLGSTLFYHDHAFGLTRLNVWAGLSGAYIIEGQNDIALNVSTNCDIPLIIQDRLINATGNLLYATTSMCLAEEMLPWVMESLGNVNLVNGAVMPYVEVPRQQCRLRLINAANARQFSLDIPFYDKCQLIGTDGGLVKTPMMLTSSSAISLYPAERVDLMCDFSEVISNTSYNVTNMNTVSGGSTEIMQFRVNQPSDRKYRHVADTLNDLIDLQATWEATVDKITKDISMSETLNVDGCPTALTILEDGMLMNTMSDNVIESIIGTVEKWTFRNPTSDVHPFHLHVVHMQCGINDSTINTNELKDNVPIPMAMNSGDNDEITYICYVATMPSLSLIVGSTVPPTGFGFSTNGSYVAHCHTLEHEDNSMMTYFALIDSTEYLKASSNGDSSTKNYLLCLLLLILAIPVGVCVWYFVRTYKSIPVPRETEEGVVMSD
jgi:FtsP/CotA-like multicopper oxidase with cupredoxin domain